MPTNPPILDKLSREGAPVHFVSWNQHKYMTAGAIGLGRFLAQVTRSTHSCIALEHPDEVREFFVDATDLDGADVTGQNLKKVARSGCLPLEDLSDIVCQLAFDGHIPSGFYVVRV